MKLNFKKVYIALVFVFTYNFAFSMLNDVPIHYDEQIYRRLNDFIEGKNIDNNLFENANLKGIKLLESSLSNVVLDKADSRYSEFSNFEFKKGSKILNSNFKNSCFKDTFFYNSATNNSKYTESKILGSIFNNFIIINSDFSKSSFLNCRFANMRINAKATKECFVCNNNFNNATFKYCSFRWVAFKDNNFTRACVSNTSFKKCFIVGVDFSRAILKDVIFEKCIFVDCKSLDKIFFTGNVVFNFCEFIKTNKSSEYSKNLINTIKNLGAKVIKKPGKWKMFKKVAGSMIGLIACQGNSFISGLTSEYARSIVSDCNRACKAYLDQNADFTNFSTTACQNK